MQQQPQWGQPQWGAQWDAQQPQTATNTYQHQPQSPTLAHTATSSVVYPPTYPPQQHQEVMTAVPSTQGTQSLPAPLGGGDASPHQVPTTQRATQRLDQSPPHLHHQQLHVAVAPPQNQQQTPNGVNRDEDEVEAEIVLQVQNIAVNEAQNGVERKVLDAAELIVLELRPTPEELEAACQNLQLAPGSLTRTDGKPLLFVIAGDHKIPVTEQVPITKQTPFSFTFAMPHLLFVEVVFPQSGAEDELDAFDMLLRNYGCVCDITNSASTEKVKAQSDQPAEGGERKISTKIAGGIGVATLFAANGIRRATGLVSGAISGGAQKIVDNTTPAERPVQVPSAVKGSVKSVRGLTKGAVTVSAGFAGSLFGATAAVGQGIGSKIARLKPKSSSSSPTFEGVKEVAGAAVGGVGLVFVAATDAPRQVVTSGCDGVTAVVTHKLGAEAGEVADDGLGVVKDVVTVKRNIHHAGVRAILHKTGKEAASQCLTEMGGNKKKEEGDGGKTNSNNEVNGAAAVPYGSNPPPMAPAPGSPNYYAPSVPPSFPPSSGGASV